MAVGKHGVAAAGALALVLALAGCDGGSGTGAKGGESPGATATGSPGGAGGERTTYRLGEESPEVESTMQASSGARFTLTPTRVRTGTEADMKASGLEEDGKKGPQIPVHVWTKITHKSGKPMKVGDMDDDLVVRTDEGTRTRALIVLLGEAKWTGCPAPDTEKELGPGQSQEICTTFLIPADQKAAAVEMTRGFYKEPLEWPAAG
ncbi:hypothetical protein [Streptomyces sudanensis]|uniref:hypothetical protein n=1 Tax=Streptomyces TaxID=1883 RepID=UPI00029A95DD